MIHTVESHVHSLSYIQWNLVFIHSPIYCGISCSFSSLAVCRMLASKLNMSSDDAERWIVNLIRNAKLDAKIDAMEVYKGLTCTRM